MIKGQIDIPEFSFGELEDLQVCAVMYFEYLCTLDWSRDDNNGEYGSGDELRIIFNKNYHVVYLGCDAVEWKCSKFENGCELWRNCC